MIILVTINTYYNSFTLNKVAISRTRQSKKKPLGL